MAVQQVRRRLQVPFLTVLGVFSDADFPLCFIRFYVVVSIPPQVQAVSLTSLSLDTCEYRL